MISGDYYDDSMQKIEYNGLIYEIDIFEKTASVIGGTSQTDEILIPRSLYIQSMEFLITSISNGAFQMIKTKSVKFPEDSEVKSIENFAFTLSSIESISIPAKLVELGEEWCYETAELCNFKVSPNNPRFKVYNEKMIIGKSSLKSENFDVLVFCSRDVTKVTIPSFIKTIGSSSFASCQQLQSVEIPEDSQLEIIKKDAFYQASFEYFTIPPHLTRICDGAFSFCIPLKTLIISKNSTLTTIEKNAFSNSSIESLSIPASLIDLQNGWCNDVTKLNSIKVDPNNKRYCCLDEKMIIGKSSIDNENYDVLIYCAKDIKEIKIPSFIKIIGDFAFSYSPIEKFTLPPHITKICEGSFSSCQNLNTIEIPENSELETIEEEVFSCSPIEKFTISSKLINLNEKCFYEASNLNTIFVSPNNPRYLEYDDKIIIGKSSLEKDIYDVVVFCFHNIKTVLISNFIEKIGSFSFYECENIKSVEFQPDSKVQLIGQNAFACSSIQSFIVPVNVYKIDERAFSSCSLLEKIIIPKNSKLQIIEKFAFSWTYICSILIPSHVIYIGENAFYQCINLKIVEIDENSKINAYYFKEFYNCPDLIIMIPTNFYLNNFFIYDVSHVM